MAERYSEAEIHYMDGGVTTMGHDGLRVLVTKAVSCVPSDVADAVMEECRFFMFEPDQLGWTIRNKFIEGKNLILLHDNLLLEPMKKQIHIILHEVAHYHLSHKAGLNMGDCSIEENERQEDEADSLAKEWASRNDS